MMTLGALLVLGSLCAADAAPTGDDLKLEVRRLVRQLDAEDLADRDEAEAALLKLGAAALDLLPESADAAPERKLRLDRVRGKLERALADAAAKSTTVSLAADRIKVSAALKAIEQQTGNKIIDNRARFGQEAPDLEIKLALDKAPFWQALDTLLDRAQLSVYAFGEERGVHVIARPQGQAARDANRCYSGPFRCETIGVTAERNLRLPEATSLTVEVEIAWEPRLKPISLRLPLDTVKAVNENGQALPVADRKAAIESPAGDDTTAVKLSIPLQLPSRASKQIANLKGTLDAILPGRTETFTFGDLTKAKDVSKRSAGVTVTLESVARNNELWQVRMRVKFDEAGDALASHRGWVFKNEAYLETADGKTIAFDGFETTRQSRNEVGMAYGFDLNEPPEKLKFVYKTPGTLITKGFDFELKDIPLP